MTLTVSNSNNSDAIDVYGTTGANGAIVKLIGNGSTTPSKTIRVANGAFTIINDAFSLTALSLTDGGSLTTAGGLNNTAVGNVTASTGAFTTLLSSGAITANGRLFVSDSANQPTTLSVTNSGTNGANILLAGNGATTPNKSIRSNGGYLQVCNSAYSACPVSISDAGNISSSGGIDNTVIGATTASTGAFTTLSATGLITPSSTAGIKGTSTSDNANAGSVGEYQTATSASTAITTGTTTNIVSLTLSAGDWDVSGVVNYVPAAGTTATVSYTGISTSSGALQSIGSITQYPFTAPAGMQQTIPTPTVRVSVSATTTVYVVANIAFSGGTCNTLGFIRARRVR
ncbi:hypothetical protein KEH56_24295 [Burkholderia cenocepacia]|uniref:hypothetical protein n=1 Tax=Burkholderia cenocepacia TaxID=95486 RepID=UPI001BABB8D5|nr:hypothetical protein [Burkholderia cenocepacia]QUN42426.1 hypothetical protein KEH56_24295 [Burkholderia cenocepacia]QUO26174.1 hypothetical protein KEH57_04405 [Burkholderia cenocepacia]